MLAAFWFRGKTVWIRKHSAVLRWDELDVNPVLRTLKVAAVDVRLGGNGLMVLAKAQFSTPGRTFSGRLYRSTFWTSSMHARAGGIVDNWVPFAHERDLSECSKLWLVCSSHLPVCQTMLSCLRCLGLFTK